MEVKNTEFFKNIKVLPPPGTTEFQQLIDWEIEKCLGGVTVNGVKFSGWLYWHLNHWKIRVDKIDRFGNIVKFPLLPNLRDNEWIRAEYIEQARIARCGYLEVGHRQSGKSEAEASISGYNAVLFENSQNVIVGGKDDDISLIRDKIDFGLSNLWEGLAIPKLDKDWRKSMVRLGYKTKGNEDKVWSYLIIRNVTRGTNTEGPAGTTAKSFIIDEIGKFPFGQVFEASKPAFVSEFGWRAVPILMGTGGSFEKGEDAQRYFNNPDANNFLGVIDPSTGKKTCVFISGEYRQDCKYDMKLSDWLIREGKLEEGSYPELDKITIKVANKEEARTKILQEREEKAKDPNKVEYLKAIMYNPLTIEECFLSSSDNIYNVELAQKVQDTVIANEDFGTPIILSNIGSKIEHKFTNKLPIRSYPTNINEDKDAPICIWEFPITEKPPFGLYTAGVDPYRQGKAHYSTSLGAVYIYKRMHDINSEKFQNMFVASYVARPDDRTAWWQQARWLIRYYNARTLVENDDISFIDYMTSVGDDHYLEPQPDWLKAIAPKSTIDRKYGISTSNKQIRDHVLSSLKKYSEERLYAERDEAGSIISEILGMSRIRDIMLLEEMKKYNEDGNFDRIIAASLAITLANHLDPIVGKIGESNENAALKSYFSTGKSKIVTPFSNIHTGRPRVVRPF